MRKQTTNSAIPYAYACISVSVSGDSDNDEVVRGHDCTECQATRRRHNECATRGTCSTSTFTHLYCVQLLCQCVLLLHVLQHPLYVLPGSLLTHLMVPGGQCGAWEVSAAGAGACVGVFASICGMTGCGQGRQARYLNKHYWILCLRPQVPIML